jgi:regulatory factor X, other
MRSDWLRFVSPKAIVQRELPCGESLAEQILREEVVNLLSPENKFSNGGQNGDSEINTPPRKRARMDIMGNSNPPTFATFDTPEETTTTNTTSNVTETALPRSDGASMTQGVLDQWAMWLCKLPQRFPRVPPRVFLWCMESVGAGALRDITVAGGEGFGAWWVVRCWMDEWMGWIAEKGGFLDMDADTELTGNIIHNISRNPNNVDAAGGGGGGHLGNILTY